MLNAFFQLVPFQEDPPAHTLLEEKEERKKKRKKLKQSQQQKTFEEDEFNHNEGGGGEDKWNEGDSSFDFSSISSDEEEVQAAKYQNDPDKLFNKVNLDGIVKVLMQNHKSQEDITMLQQALIHNTFFMRMRRQITETMYLELFSEIQLNSFHALETIFEVGDEGDKFYIILSGEVYILAPSHEHPIQLPPDPSSPYPSILQRQQSNSVAAKGNGFMSPKNSSIDKIKESPRKNSIHKPQQDHSKSPNNNLLKQAIFKANQVIKLSNEATPNSTKIVGNFSRAASMENHSAVSPRNNAQNSIVPATTGIAGKVLSIYPNSAIIRKLGTGESFGEIALRMNKKRTATVVSKTNTQMAVIHKKAFDRILGDFFQKQWDEKYDFLQNLELFKGYSKHFLSNVVMNLRKKTYHYNDTIYQEDSDKMRLYFVRSGEVELAKKAVLDSASLRLLLPYAKKNLDQKIVLSQKFTNDWFGEVEIMQNIKRFTSARCVSTKVEVFTVSSVKLLTNLNSEEFLRDLRRSSQMIHRWRDEHYKAMLKQIYDQRDPLNKTFRNPQIGKALVEQKFKSEFLKSNPTSICMPNQPTLTEFTAKKAYFDKIKDYVNKITDVIGTISELKEAATGIKLPDIRRSQTKMASKIRSKTTVSQNKPPASLPRISECPSAKQALLRNQNSSLTSRAYQNSNTSNNNQSFVLGSLFTSPNNTSSITNLSRKPIIQDSQQVVFPVSKTGKQTIFPIKMRESQNLNGSPVIKQRLSVSDILIEEELDTPIEIRNQMSNNKKINNNGILDELMVTGKDNQLSEDNNASTTRLKKIQDDSTNQDIDQNTFVPTEMEKQESQEDIKSKNSTKSQKSTVKTTPPRDKKKGVSEIIRAVEERLNQSNKNSNLSLPQLKLQQYTSLVTPIPNRMKKYKESSQEILTRGDSGQKIEKQLPNCVLANQLIVEKNVKKDSDMNTNLNSATKKISHTEDTSSVVNTTSNQLQITSMEDSFLQLNLSSLQSARSNQPKKLFLSLHEPAPSNRISSGDPSFLEKLYEKIAHSKRVHNIRFNDQLNQKVFQQGIANFSRQQHQKKLRVEDFSNLNHIKDKLASPRINDIRERAQKINSIKNFHLDAVMQFKYEKPVQNYQDLLLSPRSTRIYPKSVQSRKKSSQSVYNLARNDISLLQSSLIPNMPMTFKSRVFTGKPNIGVRSESEKTVKRDKSMNQKM